MKKTLFLSLLTIFSIGLFAQPTATDLWTATGNYDTSWYDATAIAAKTVTLTTAAQLAGVSKLNNNASATPTEQFAGWTIKLGADIDLSAHYWEPIGRFSLPAGFQGNFDGQGHIIRGLYINVTSTDYAGAALFAFVTGTAGTTCTFKNFYIESGSISSAKNFAAAVIGQARYVALSFEKVGVGSGFTITCPNLHLGGLIGSAYESSTGLTMADCFSRATIVYSGTATGLAGKGGFIGSAGLHQTTIVEYPIILQNCYFAGQITSSPNDLCSYFGALIGSSSNLRQAVPSKAFSTGSKNLFYASNAVSAGVTLKAVGKAYAAGDNGIDEIAVPVAIDDIKSTTTIQTLNDSRSPLVWGIVSGVNNGYPVPYMMLGITTATNPGHSLASLKIGSINKGILISGTKAGAIVKLINSNGALIKTVLSNGDTKITNLQAGLYIVESCGETQKVVVL